MKSALLLLLALVFSVPLHAADLWDIAALQRTPAVEWGAKEGLTLEVYYTGEPFGGKPTRVFAYLGRPPGSFTTTRHPAILLVHGGGGQAFRNWAERWAQRGYVALAMDLSGNGPGKIRLPDGGPQLTQSKIFLAADDDAPFREGWTYHAAAAVIRGHSLLATLPEVDPARIGIHGISWGGYLTCIVAGLDARLKVAVPLYGCGFLHENCYWKHEMIDPMTPAQRARWAERYDPSSYLGRVRYPMLFVNGSNDTRYFLDSFVRSYELVRPELRHLSVIVGLKHGHLFDIPEVDRFIDAVLRGSPLPAQVARPVVAAGALRAKVAGDPKSAVKAELHVAPATGPWPERKFATVPATVAAGEVSAPLPAERPIMAYFSVLDDKGVRATGAYLELTR